MGLIPTLGSGHPSFCPEMALFKLTYLLFIMISLKTKQNKTLNLKLTLKLPYPSIGFSSSCGSASSLCSNHYCESCIYFIITLDVYIHEFFIKVLCSKLFSIS